MDLKFSYSSKICSNRNQCAPNSWTVSTNRIVATAFGIYTSLNQRKLPTSSCMPCPTGILILAILGLAAIVGATIDHNNV